MENVNSPTGEEMIPYHQLEALYRVTQAITAHLELDVVLDTIARSTAELLHTDTGVILLLDESGETLTIRGAYGLSDAVVQGTRDRLGESIAGRVVQQGQPLIVHDLPHDPRFANPAANGEGLLACASVPLRLGEAIIGTLDVHSKTDPWAFDASHLRILELLASQAAIAIENARLYETLQHAHDELEAHVQARTAELVAINARLQHEVAERARVDATLQKERNLLRTLIDNLPEYIFVKDADSRFLLVNELSDTSAHDALPNGLVGKTDFDLFPPALAQKYYTDDQAIMHSGEAMIDQEEPGMDLDTHARRWRVTSKISFRDDQGKVAGLVGISRDITDQRRAQEALEQRNRELTALNQMHELLQTCRTEQDAYKIIVHVNEQLFPRNAGRMYLFDSSQVMLTPVASWGHWPPGQTLIPVAQCPKLHPDDHLSLPPTIEIAEHCPCAAAHPAPQACIPLMTTENVIGMMHLYDDFRAEEDIHDAWEDSPEAKMMLAARVAGQYALFLANLRLRETLRMEAIRDPLTGLYNRRHMEAALEREAYRVARNKCTLGIIMLDIDHFKLFNDTYGHDAGDAVLRELGAFLLSHTRGEDIACRYGGEEFLVIMSDASLTTAQKRAEELWAKIHGVRIYYQGQTFTITLSFGVAALPEHGPNVNALLKAADTALYQAKATGRDRVVVAPV